MAVRVGVGVLPAPTALGGLPGVPEWGLAARLGVGLQPVRLRRRPEPVALVGEPGASMSGEPEMTLEKALFWARTLSEPERARELDSTDTDYLARATARLLVEYDRLTGDAHKPSPEGSRQGGNLQDYIRQRPISEKPDDAPACPFCTSRDIEARATVTTDMGWVGGINPNHRETGCSCLACDSEFSRHCEGLSVWYTDRPIPYGPTRVLLGIATDRRGTRYGVEDYQYTCSKCEGAVHLKRRPIPNQNLVIQPGVDAPTHSLHVHCTSCGREGEIADTPQVPS